MPSPRFLFIVFLALATAGCASNGGAGGAAGGDEWETSSPAAEHLDPARISAMLARVRDGSYPNVHGIVLVKNDKLVAEAYFPGRDSTGNTRAFDRDLPHEVHSVTKSVNALLIGIAIDQGLIRGGVDQKLASFFPEYADVFAADPRKGAIRLKDCLSMTAGLAWDESIPYSDPRNDHVIMNKSRDPIRYVLERPLATAPGTHFNYCSGISIVLGEIIHKVSGLRADDFAKQYLFTPLRIADYQWLRYPNGVVQTGGGLSLRPRDMAKIGSLALHGGRWRGKRIVSEAWIRESVRQQAPDEHYGYQWWLLGRPEHPAEAYGALGRGGQVIAVSPQLDLIAVFTGWNDVEMTKTPPFDMLKRYIVPADERVRQR